MAGAPAKGVIEGFIKRFRALDAKADSIMGKAKQEVKSLREDQREILEEAKNKDVNVRALRAAIKQQRLAEKIEAVRDNLDEEDRDDLDSIKSSLGWLADTPLGEAAMMTATKGRRSKAALVEEAPAGSA